MKVVTPNEQFAGEYHVKRLQGIPARAVNAMSFFVGEWSSETYQNGEKIGHDRDTRAWMPGKHAVMMKAIGQENGRRLAFFWNQWLGRERKAACGTLVFLGRALRDYSLSTTWNEGRQVEWRLYRDFWRRQELRR